MHEPAFLSPYAYLVLSTSLLVAWLILYGSRPDLRRRTGFDLESLLFSFAVGGIVFAAYDALTGTAPADSMRAERHHPRRRYHRASVLVAPAVFLGLIAVTRLNPIYAATLGLVAGFLATLYCRGDLWVKMLVSGALFSSLCFVVFAAFDLAFPGYVAAVWNLPALSRVFVADVPLEELMFAFTFGLYWSSVYEHLAWKRSPAVAKTLPAESPVGSAR
jgi:lycopene cyclase-like protein